jgi:hypothetical protein
MGINYAELNITETPLKESYIFPTHLCKSLRGPTYDYVSEEFISDELIAQLAELNLEISGAVLFQKLPGYSNPLHTDVVIVNDSWSIWHCAVNWDLTNAKSIMEWYSTSEKEIWPSIVDTGLLYHLSGIHYGYLGNKNTSTETMKLIESTRITKPTLVRTDVPHQIKNLDDKNRWSLSVRFTVNYKWEEALDIFKPIIDT